MTVAFLDHSRATTLRRMRRVSTSATFSVLLRFRVSALISCKVLREASMNDDCTDGLIDLRQLVELARVLD